MGILDDLVKDWEGSSGGASEWKDAMRRRREAVAHELAEVVETAAAAPAAAPEPVPYHRPQPAPAAQAHAAPPALHASAIADRLRQPGGMREAVILSAILQRRGR